MDLVCKIVVGVVECFMFEGVLVVEIGNECVFVEVVFLELELIWLIISVGDDMVFLVMVE